MHTSFSVILLLHDVSCNLFLCRRNCQQMHLIVIWRCSYRICSHSLSVEQV